MRNLASCIVFTSSLAAFAQVAQPAPRAYRGVQTRVDGIFVTPIANAPFTAEVEIFSHTKLPNGTEHVMTTRNHIARGSSGRIRNERRQMVPASFEGEPLLFSVHLYDPSSRMSIFYEPSTRLARETLLPAPPAASAEQRAPGVVPTPPEVAVTDLGPQTLNSLPVTGTRKVRTVPAAFSGTGQALQIVDEYWYSSDLAIYLIIRHNDPRTGEQIVAVTKVNRGEPPGEDLQVPAEYKVVDETPPELTGSGSNSQAAATGQNQGQNRSGCNGRDTRSGRPQ